MKVSEKIQKDLEAIYIGNLGTVDDNLQLPLEGKFGSKFVWETSADHFITTEGIVHRPLHGMGHRNVTLTVKAYLEDEVGERVFHATVLQEGRETIVTEIKQVNVECKISEKPLLPSVVVVHSRDGRCLTLPVEWDAFEPLGGEGKICVKGAVEGTEKMAEALILYKENIEEEHTPERKGEFFPINEVRLKEGTIHYEYQQKMLAYLKNVNDDQMLYNFRKASGLDTQGAEPMTGWDADECKLKGHTTGHYLSGLALAWGATGEDCFKKKIEYMVNALGECQEAFAASGEYHRGFLSAYSEEQFDLLEAFTKYPEIWAPYYTLDKIMSGLYDCYVIAENEKAREILDLMGDWVYDRLSRLSKETLDKMWSMYIAGEYGGMLGTMVKLYELTGKETHKKAAELFANEKLFYPMEENCDTLEDMHANQHIPQIMGAMDMFQIVGGAKWWKIGKNFWEIITGGHIYTIGGVGETEMLHRAGTTCAYLTEKAAESCASYNMLRLTGQVFHYTFDGNMMDYYDNTLRNHILTSCSHTEDGGTTYFMPLGAGQRKEYSTIENTCCHGTGMESRFRYMENIYAQDEEYTYINLYIDSVLNGLLEIETDEDAGEIKVRCLRNLDYKLKLQIPAWMRENYEVFVNGVKEKTSLERGYVVIGRRLNKLDEVIIRSKWELRIVENNSDSSYINVAYGPYILAGLSGAKEILTLPCISKFVKTGKNEFEADGMVFKPFALVDLESYHVYFKREL